MTRIIDREDDVSVEFVDEVAGLYFRSIWLRRAGLKVPQHIHPYDHATICANGSATVYVDGKAVDTLFAGNVIKITANHLHEFVSLEPNTRLICVHDAKSAEAIKEK